MKSLLDPKSVSQDQKFVSVPVFCSCFFKKLVQFWFLFLSELKLHVILIIDIIQTWSYPAFAKLVPFLAGFSFDRDQHLYFDDTCVVPERLEGKTP